MTRITEQPALNKRHTEQHEGFELIEAILQRMRWAVEQEMTNDFDSALSRRLDQLIQIETLCAEADQ